MKAGIIGCGAIGTKRANVIKAPHEIKALCDTDINRAYSLAEKFNLKDILITDDYNELLSKADIDIAIVSTIVKYSAPVTLCAVRNNKHVIVEKPAGMNADELTEIINISREKNLTVKVGFNHRYHPAMLKAKELLDSCPDKLGSVMFIRGRYGHGGRTGYNHEWRADPNLSGGGELIDQGVHLIDLSRWFMGGNFTEINGLACNYFWDMPVDDNAFLCLRTKDGRVSWLHVSCTEWKNMFSFEIYCKKAKLMIEGLGGSYGTERLYYYQMLPEMGPPETLIYEFPRGDSSWLLEWHEVVNAVEHKQPLKMGDISDAYEALKIVGSVYQKGITHHDNH